jgi:methionyl-tRNA formyltransferase
VPQSRYGGTLAASSIREGNGVVIVAGADARRGRNRNLAIERVRTDNGSEYAATECFRTLGGYLTSHP